VDLEEWEIASQGLEMVLIFLARLGLSVLQIGPKILRFAKVGRVVQVGAKAGVPTPKPATVGLKRVLLAPSLAIEIGQDIATIIGGIAVFGEEVFGKETKPKPKARIREIQIDPAVVEAVEQVEKINKQIEKSIRQEIGSGIINLPVQRSFFFNPCGPEPIATFLDCR